MNRLSRSFALILILMIAISGLSQLMTKPAYAQSIPTPAIPEFTVQFVGPPYVNPTTYHLDQNTGQIVANIGYTNEYTAAVITIKNQPFDAAYGSLYYNVRLKNHDSDYWYYPLDQLFSMSDTYPTQTTDSDYTNVTLTVQSNFLLLGAQNDIQVEAMLGNIGRHQQYSDTGQYLGAPYVFNGQTSDWSNTQTISVPANIPLSATSPSPTLTTTSTLPPTTAPSVPEFSWLAILPLFVSMLFVAVILRHRKLLT